MQRMFVFLLLAILFPLQIFAGVGDSDNRYYVTDEMWAQEPYKKFVCFEVMAKDGKELVPSGRCTAQYVSPNLILSAGHCTDKDSDGYRVRNYKHEEFLVELIETPYDGQIGTLGDWAVWLVTDPKYYSDSYFNLKTPTKTMDVLNAGWGWARILDDDDLLTIRNIFKDIEEEHGEKITINSVSIELSKRMMKMGLEAIYDLKDRFKASECKIVFEDCNYYYEQSQNTAKEKKAKRALDKLKNICNNQSRIYSTSRTTQNYPYILATTCDSWGGNSGGGYFSSDGKTLYGTCSFGTDSFEDSRNDDYITSSKQFEKRIKELTKTFDSKNPVETNIAKIPTNIFGEEDSTNASETDENIAEQKMFRRMDNRIQRLTLETNDLDTKLTDVLPNLQNMTDEQLLKFLDKLVERDVKKERLEKLQKAYEEAKAREGSWENRLLTAATTAATGFGGMELAQGLAEQKADEAAAADMAAYIDTMRCTYGDGTSVRAGLTPVELPGGNNNEMMKLRNEYFALAESVKNRKESLGMAPGIESEVILDKAEMGLYDDENTGITGGKYSSLYRADMLNSGPDKTLIKSAQETSQNRVDYGGQAAGVGAIVGTVGNIAINSDLFKKDK